MGRNAPYPTQRVPRTIHPPKRLGQQLVSLGAVHNPCGAKRSQQEHQKQQQKRQELAVESTVVASAFHLDNDCFTSINRRQSCMRQFFPTARRRPPVVFASLRHEPMTAEIAAMTDGKYVHSTEETRKRHHVDNQHMHEEHGTKKAIEDLDSTEDIGFMPTTTASSLGSSIPSVDEGGKQHDAQSDERKDNDTAPKALHLSRSVPKSATSSNTNNSQHKRPKRLQQMYLDLGQHDFAQQVLCPVCGMLYVHGLDDDNKQHQRVCQDFAKGVLFSIGGYPTRIAETTATTTSTAMIVEIRPTDPPALQKILEQVQAIVENELGFAPSSGNSNPGPMRISYLYICNKRVIGLAVVELLEHAFEYDQNHLERSNDSHRAMLGIYQLWVHNNYRKQGIATRLVDVARRKMVFGTIVPVELVAFSSPTLSGIRFAQSYYQIAECHRPLLVYDCVS